jgi:hypothetical protein
MRLPARLLFKCLWYVLGGNGSCVATEGDPRAAAGGARVSLAFGAVLPFSQREWARERKDPGMRSDWEKIPERGVFASLAVNSLQHRDIHDGIDSIT